MKRITLFPLLGSMLTLLAWCQPAMAQTTEEIAGLQVTDGAVQINAQQDFDRWVAAMNAGDEQAARLLATDVSLNADVAATATTGHVVPALNAKMEGNGHTITLGIDVMRPDGEQGLGSSFVGELGGTVRNVRFEGHIEGNAKFLATVAKVMNAGGLMENIRSSVTIVSHITGDASAGGIVGHTTGGTMRNIVYDGVMTSASGATTEQCGGICGWADGGLVMENVLVMADMSGLGDWGCNTVARNPGAVAGRNVFATTPKADTPNFCRIVSAEELASGEICFLLNNQTFFPAIWRQDLAAGDPLPTMDGSRMVVYPAAEGYDSFDPNDEGSLNELCEALQEAADEFLGSELIDLWACIPQSMAMQVLVDTYDTASTLEQLAERYKGEQELRQWLTESAAAYQLYAKNIEAIKEILAERSDIGGADRDYLEQTYLGSYVEPGQDKRIIFGSYEYIIENRQLFAAQVVDEIARAQELLRLAIANGYAVGSEITDMIDNANFAKGFEGWQGDLFGGYEASRREGSTLVGAECVGGGTANMWQEIAVANSGVYELQVGGAWRPFNQWLYNSIEYYPYIYINDNANYILSSVEDYIPRAEAEDGVNCNLNPGAGWWPDLDFVSEAGDTIGYVPQGTQGICDAVQAGRYDNRILVYAQAGDVLRIGICQPRSDYQQGASEWVGIAGIHLYYHGAITEANDALDRVLANMLRRAYTLLSIQIALDDDYVKFPNWSQALKDLVAEQIELGEKAETPEEKYQVICTLSQAFKDIIACKKAYRSYFTRIESIYAAAYTASEVDPSTTDMVQMAEQFRSEAMAAYENGTLSTQEALDCEIANTLPLNPTIDENGVYHIANTAQMAGFASLANATTTEANGQVYHVVLDGDVSMNAQLAIRNFFGTFDGQGHTLNLNITSTDNGAAPFTALRGGAVLRNLKVRGRISTIGKFAGTVAAYTYDGATLENIESYAEINGENAGDGTHGGLLGVNYRGETVINNCLFAGSITGDSHSNGGFVGWAEGLTRVTNCLLSANLAGDQYECNTIGRANACQSDNCYFVAPYGVVPAGATQVSDEQLVSGQVALMLNHSLSRPDVAWRQDLGNDLQPTVDAGHKVVYMAADGTCTNEPQAEVQTHEGTFEDPFLVYNAGDLVMLRSLLKPGQMNCVNLMADIDMSEVTSWTPLNTREDYYNGKSYQNFIYLEGHHHVIKNFTCTQEGQDYNSFFGVLCGMVTNVGFENARVACTQSGTGVLAGYLGHPDYLVEEGQPDMSIIIGVWVTGTLTTGNHYTGGLVGNIGGPSAIMQSYTNIHIQSQGTDNYVGGLVGRVRHQLSMIECYAAGSIDCASPNVGGIIGGGMNDNTPLCSFANIAVWNNTTANFGQLREGLDQTSDIAYYDGTNFAQMQQAVCGWSQTWKCSMQEGEYPTLFSSSTDAIASVQAARPQAMHTHTLGGVRVSHPRQGLFIQNGRKVLMK